MRYYIHAIYEKRRLGWGETARTSRVRLFNIHDTRVTLPSVGQVYRAASTVGTSTSGETVHISKLVLLALNKRARPQCASPTNSIQRWLRALDNAGDLSQWVRELKNALRVYPFCFNHSERTSVESSILLRIIAIGVQPPTHSSEPTPGART